MIIPNPRLKKRKNAIQYWSQQGCKYCYCHYYYVNSAGTASQVCGNALHVEKALSLLMSLQRCMLHHAHRYLTHSCPPVAVHKSPTHSFLRLTNKRSSTKCYGRARSKHVQRSDRQHPVTAFMHRDTHTSAHTGWSWLTANITQGRRTVKKSGAAHGQVKTSWGLGGAVSPPPPPPPPVGSGQRPEKFWKTCIFNNSLHYLGTVQTLKTLKQRDAPLFAIAQKCIILL